MSDGNALPVKRLSYTHDAMIDLILQEPTVTHAELAEIFGYTAGWVQRVCGSDAFNARLADRKAQLIDPQISRTLNDRLRGVTIKALDIIDEKLSSADAGAQMALDALGIATSSMSKVRK